MLYIPRNDKTCIYIYSMYIYIYVYGIPVYRYTSYRCMQYINVCNFCRFLQVLSIHYSASVQPDDLSLEATQPQEWCKTSTCDLSQVPASKVYNWNMAIFIRRSNGYRLSNYKCFINLKSTYFCRWFSSSTWQYAKLSCLVLLPTIMEVK